MRSRLSASGAAGSRPLTLRAFTGRTARAGRDELLQAPAQPGGLGLLQRQGQRGVAGLLLRPHELGEELDAGAVDLRDGGLEGGQRRELDVRVAPLAEGVGERLDVAQDAAELLAREARLVDLQHGAQAPRGDAHVVHALDVVGVQDALGMVEQLLGAQLDGARRSLRIREVGGEPWDVACLGHARDEGCP